MTLENAKLRAFDRLNLIGINADIYSVLYRYKVFREMSESDLDKVYDEISKALGF